MLNRFKSFALAGSLLFAAVACDKDEDQTVLNMSAVPQLTASATTATISADPTQGGTNAVTYSWTKADFGYQAATTYTLQFAKQGSNFATTQDFVVEGGSKSFTVKELNDIYNSLDCKITAQTPPTMLEVRVSASVGKAAAAAISPVKTIMATPYAALTMPADKWAIIGSATAGGWDTETKMNYDFCTRTWSVTLPLTAAEFKFRANNGWGKNLGDKGDGDPATSGRNLVINSTAVPNPANIKLATAGTYTVTLDVNGKPSPTFKLKQ